MSTFVAGIVLTLLPQAAPAIAPLAAEEMERTTPLYSSDAPVLRIQRFRERKTDHEKLLYSGPARLVSRNGSHFATANTVDGHDVIRLDGQVVGSYDEVFTIFVGNADGSLLAAVADDGKPGVVVNGELFHWFDQLEQVWMDESGEHFAASGRSDGKLRLVVDGSTVRLPDTAGNAPLRAGSAKVRRHLPILWNPFLVFSADGGHYLACVFDGERAHVLRDGKITASHSRIGDACISRDGQHFAYTCGTDEAGGELVLDGESTKIRGKVRNLRFVGDPEQLNYVIESPVRNREKRRQVIGDYRSKPYDDVGLPGLGTGSAFAFLARRGKATLLVVDGKESKFAYGKKDEFATLYTPIFSPDGQRLAIIQRDGDQERLVVDGAKTEPCDEIRSVLFSPDSAHIAYTARTGNTTTVVLDGKPVTAFDAPRQKRGMLGGLPQGTGPRTLNLPWLGRTGTASLQFSPDSRHLVSVSHFPDVGDQIAIDGRNIETRQGTCDYPFRFEDGQLRLVVESPEAREYSYLDLRLIAK